MSNVKSEEIGEIPPKQTFVILVFLVGAAILPFLGLIPFLLYIAVLIYSIRSLKGFDKTRGSNVLPAYLAAIRGICYRMLLWLFLSFSILLTAIASGDATISEYGVADDYAHLFQVFSLAVALHFALLVRTGWHLKKGRITTAGDYTSLLLAMLYGAGGFFEKLLVREKLKGK